MESDKLSIDKESKEKDDQWIYCELCEYKCKTIKTMTKHNHIKHESEITCNICGKIYKTTSTLDEHKKAEHEASQDKPSGKTQSCKVGKSCEEQMAELEY